MRDADITWTLGPLPELILLEWDYESNHPLTPEAADPASTRQLTWRCAQEPAHMWKAPFRARLHSEGCPECSIEQSLAVLAPTLAAMWHPEQNETLTAADVGLQSPQSVTWRCTANRTHQWRARVMNQVHRFRQDELCPICAHGWNTDALRVFLKSLLQHLDTLSQAELWTIYQQAGLLTGRGPRTRLLEAVLEGKVSARTLKKFTEDETTRIGDVLARSQTLPPGVPAPYLARHDAARRGPAAAGHDHRHSLELTRDSPSGQ